MQKKVGVIITSLVVIVIAFIGLYLYNANLKDSLVLGNKEIEVVVVDKNSNYHKEYKCKTDAMTLGDALDEMGIITTTDSSMGRYIISVDGIKANEDKKQWWKIKKNDKDLSTGIDQASIEDKDKVELDLMVGW